MASSRGNRCGALLCATIVAFAGCAKSDSPSVNPQPGSQNVTATSTSSDLRKLSEAEVAAKIKKNLGGEYTSVSLTSEGANRYVGTATTAEGKAQKLSVTVTVDTISYEAKDGDGFMSGTIRQSSKEFEASTKTP